MNKVLIDTNIWVDVMLRRPQFVEASTGVLMACIEEGVKMVVAATSLKDVFYFASKSAGPDAGYRSVNLMLELAEVAQIDSIVCKMAIDLERPDYEDGVIAACALAEQVEEIVTRDETAFADAGVPRRAPSEFLDELGYESVAI